MAEGFDYWYETIANGDSGLVDEGVDSSKLTDLFKGFRAWLVSNPSWLDDKGFGGMQAAVMTPSRRFPSLEFPNPGMAEGFDYWYETIGKYGSGLVDGRPDFICGVIDIPPLIAECPVIGGSGDDIPGFIFDKPRLVDTGGDSSEPVVVDESADSSGLTLTIQPVDPSWLKPWFGEIPLDFGLDLPGFVDEGGNLSEPIVEEFVVCVFPDEINSDNLIQAMASFSPSFGASSNVGEQLEAAPIAILSSSLIVK
jgi:hypothetical protein